jgi:hypothetical protein
MKKLWNEYAAAWSTPERIARQKILEKHLTPDIQYWTMQNRESEIEMQGASFAEIESDGRLRRIRGFFGQPSQ